jgi:hypothetical protein
VQAEIMNHLRPGRTEIIGGIIDVQGY